MNRETLELCARIADGVAEENFAIADDHLENDRVDLHHIRDAGARAAVSIADKIRAQCPAQDKRLDPMSWYWALLIFVGGLGVGAVATYFIVSAAIYHVLKSRW